MRSAYSTCSKGLKMTDEERKVAAVLAAVKMPERDFEAEVFEEESEGEYEEEDFGEDFEEEDFTEDEEGEHTDSEDEEWEQRKQARLRPGHCVLVHSLVRRPELNDCLGELVQFYADSGGGKCVWWWATCSSSRTT